MNTYEQLNNPNAATVICSMTAQGDGSICKGRLCFSPKTSENWELDVLQEDPPFDGIYHLLAKDGSPITPLSVYVDGHKWITSGWLAATIPPGILSPGDPTWFVVDHHVPANLFAISVL